MRKALEDVLEPTESVEPIRSAPVLVAAAEVDRHAGGQHHTSLLSGTHHFNACSITDEFVATGWSDANG